MTDIASTSSDREAVDGFVWVEPGLAERQPRRWSRRRRALELSLGIGVPIFLLLAWQFSASTGVIDKRLYPAPTTIVREAWKLVDKDILWPHFWASLQRVLWGFFLGSVTGIVLGVATGMSRLLRAALEPLLNGLYTIPKLALLPVFLTIFGFGEAPKIVLIAVTVFFFVWISTMSAIVTVPEGYRIAAKSFGISRIEMFRHVILPAALPQIFVGLRIAAGVSVLVLIGVEFVIGTDGLGFLINNSRSLLINRRMFVGIAVAALLGVVFTMLVRAIGRRLTPWAADDDSPTRL